MGLFIDDVSGKELHSDCVRGARKGEIDVIESMKVWKRVPRPTDKKVLAGRWVDVNKGDVGQPKHRSRYVVREFKRGAAKSMMAEYFAAMPPLSCIKWMLIIATTRRMPDF